MKEKQDFFRENGEILPKIDKESEIISGTRKFRTSLEVEVTEIIKLWKYIKNMIFNLRNDFDVSCRLMMILSRDTFDHHTRKLPQFLMEILEKWYQSITESLCD